MTVLGYFLLILGVIGIFLPILQGTLFLVAGLYILADRAPWAKRIIHYLEKRYPKIIAEASKINKKIKNYFKKRTS